MIPTLKRYNPVIVIDKAVTLAKYKVLPSGTDIIAGFVRPCRAYTREMMLCTVAIAKW
jgi:hypothetical protein